MEPMSATAPNQNASPPSPGGLDLGPLAEQLAEMLETRRAKRPRATPQLNDMLSSKAKQLIGLLLALLLGSSGATLAQIQALWGLPDRVGKIEASLAKIEKLLEEK
jgi:hypothetical protein